MTKRRMEKKPTGGKNVEWKKCRKSAGQGRGRGLGHGQISPIKYSRIYYRATALYFYGSILLRNIQFETIVVQYRPIHTSKRVYVYQ